MVTYIQNGTEKKQSAYNSEYVLGNDIDLTVRGDEPDLVNFVKAHPDMTAGEIASHIVSFKEQRRVTDHSVYFDKDDGLLISKADLHSPMEKVMKKCLEKIDQQLSPLTSFYIEERSFSSTVSTAYMLSEMPMRRDAIAGLLRSYSKKGGVIAGDTERLNAGYFFGSRLEDRTNMTDKMKDFYNAFAAAAVDKRLSDLADIMDRLSEREDVSEKIPSLAEAVKTVSAQIPLSKGTPEWADQPLPEPYPGGYSQWIKDLHNWIDDAASFQTGAHINSKTSMMAVGISALIKDMALLYALTPEEADKTLEKSRKVSDSEKPKQMEAYLKLHEHLSDMKDMNIFAMTADILADERDAFRNAYCDPEVSYEAIMNGSTISFHGQKLEKSFMFPQKAEFVRDQGFIKDNASYIKDLIADAAGIYPDTQLLRDAGITDYNTAVKLTSRMSDICYYFNPCKRSDSLGKPLPLYTSPWLDYSGREGQARQLRRLAAISDEEFNFFRRSGIANSDDIGKALSSLPVDKNGTPRFNAALNQMFHKKDYNGLVSSGLLELTSVFPSLSALAPEIIEHLGRSLDLSENGLKNSALLASLDSMILGMNKEGCGRKDEKKIINRTFQDIERCVKEFTQGASNIMSSPDSIYERLILKTPVTPELAEKEQRYQEVLPPFEYLHDEDNERLLGKLAAASEKLNPIKRDIDSAISGIIADVSSGRPLEPYRSPDELRLSSLFDQRFKYTPRVIHTLAALCNGSGKSACAVLSPERIVSDFNRARISDIASFINPGIALIALECQTELLPKPVRDIIYTYSTPETASGVIENFDIIASKKNWDRSLLRTVISNINKFDQASLEKIKDMKSADFYRILDNTRACMDRASYEEKYRYSFNDNRVDIPGKDTMAIDKKHHLRAYILAPDDPRNFTVGYLTDCCQHFDGAGEDCTYAATSLGNSGIWVIEDTKTGKIEAQAWVWTDSNARSPEGKDDPAQAIFVFDNIEFANDQKAESYAGLISAYASALPQLDVHMGTGYNTISDIGERLGTDEVMATPPCYVDPESVYGDVIDTYTDYNENARVLKRDGADLVNADISDIAVDLNAAISAPSTGDALFDGHLVSSDDMQTAYSLMSRYRKAAMDSITDIDGSRMSYVYISPQSDDSLSLDTDLSLDMDMDDEDAMPADYWDFNIETEEGTDYHSWMHPEEKDGKEHVIFTMQAPMSLTDACVMSTVDYDVTDGSIVFRDSSRGAITDKPELDALTDMVRNHIENPDSGLFPSLQEVREISEPYIVITSGSISGPDTPRKADLSAGRFRSARNAFDFSAPEHSSDDIEDINDAVTI